MIEIKVNPKKYEVSITGHAGQAEKGQDIVCSAISILFYTLAQSIAESAAMLKASADIRSDDGNGYLRCEPKEEYRGNIERTYWTILVGFELVANEYPEYITLIVKE